MDLTLHQFSFSLFCIPVAAALKACDVPFQAVEVPIPRRDEIFSLTRGRYFQVPVLVHGRRVVFESGAETLEDEIERTESVRFNEYRFGHGCLTTWRRALQR